MPKVRKYKLRKFGSGGQVNKVLPNVNVYGTNKSKYTNEQLNKLSGKTGGPTPFNITDYENLWNSWSDNGRPRIAKPGLSSTIVKVVRGADEPVANYDMVTNTMHIMDGSVDDYYAELAHSKQRKDGVGKMAVQLLKHNPLSSKKYSTPGTVEYDAHEIIEPNLKEKYKGNTLNMSETLAGGRKIDMSFRYGTAKEANDKAFKLRSDPNFGKKMQQYGMGGKINIKEQNVGKFTAWAKAHGMTVQQAANTILRNREKYSPTLIKRANFAHNAAKWEDGGQIQEFGLGGNLVQTIGGAGIAALGIIGTPFTGGTSLAATAAGIGMMGSGIAGFEKDAAAKKAAKPQGMAQAGEQLVPNQYTPTFKFGGTFKGKRFGSDFKVEKELANSIVEGGEMVITPDGEPVNMNGPKHGQGDNGGIPVKLPNQSIILSDKVKVEKGKTAADVGRPYTSKIKKAQAVIDGGGTKLSKDTAQKNLNKYYSKVLDTYNTQESLKSAKSGQNMFHWGGQYEDPTSMFNGRPGTYNSQGIPIELPNVGISGARNVPSNLGYTPYGGIGTGNVPQSTFNGRPGTYNSDGIPIELGNVNISGARNIPNNVGYTPYGGIGDSASPLAPNQSVQQPASNAKRMTLSQAYDFDNGTVYPGTTKGNPVQLGNVGVSAKRSYNNNARINPAAEDISSMAYQAPSDGKGYYNENAQPSGYGSNFFNQYKTNSASPEGWPNQNLGFNDYSTPSNSSTPETGPVDQNLNFGNEARNNMVAGAGADAGAASPTGFTTNDYGIPAGQTSQPFNWGSAATMAGELAPTLYNLGQGLFGKKERQNANDYRNPYEGQINSLMANRRYNIDAGLASNEATYRTNTANMRNLGGSRGQVMGNLFGAQNTKQFGDMALYGQKNNMDNQYRGEQANQMYGLGRDTSMTRMAVDETNAANRAAEQNMIGSGLSGLQKYLLTRRQMNNQMKMGKLQINAAKSYSPFADTWVPGMDAGSLWNNNFNAFGK
jgi:hypothetical protein